MKFIMFGFAVISAAIIFTLTDSASLKGHNFIEITLDDSKNGGGGGAPNFNCTGKDGYYADTYRECHVFYRCLPDGQKWAFSCIEDDQFDEEKQTCLRFGEAYCAEYIPEEAEAESTE